MRRNTYGRAVLNGALKVHPGRYQARGPVDAAPLGDPPVHLSIAAKNAWKEIAASAPEGLLTSGDRFLLEIACVLLCRVRNRKVPPKNSEINAFANVLTKLAMTPLDRGKADLVPAAPVREHDPLAELLETN